MLSEAYIGLGSNLGDRAANIRLGLEVLGASPDTFRHPACTRPTP